VPDAITTHQHSEGLRLRRCCDPGCSVLFAICARCDRGQRYCGNGCRTRTRQQQLRAAGRRYQATETGKSKHCQRQQAYLRRQSKAVTHQSPVPITDLQGPQAGNLSSCAICGQRNPWIRPFYRLPRRRRQRRLGRHTARYSDSYAFG
jgi:hypothetical protein